MVTLDAPVLVTVSDNVCLVPSSTLPKPRLVGFDSNAPTDTPVADSGIVSVGLDPFEVTVTLPLALPATVGAKVAVKVAV